MKRSCFTSLVVLFFSVKFVPLALGQFTPAPNSPFAVGAIPVSIIVGDFNGDAKPDLAVADTGDLTTGAVFVLLGDGSGGFTDAPHTPYSTGDFPYQGIRPVALAAGNFFGHSTPDIVTANSQTSDVSLLSGGGAGVFQVMSQWEVGTQPGAIAVGDFNGDGNTDVVVANTIGQLSLTSNNDSVTILFGNGAGGFLVRDTAYFPVGTNPSSLAVADFNGDGNLDIAVANNRSNNVTVLLGDGTGGFTPATASPFAAGNGPSGIVAGDFNGDGNIDLAISNEAAGNVTVLLGDGTGGFNAASASLFAVGSGPDALAAADFNRDGNLDLAVVNETDATVTVLLGNGRGGFAPDSGSPYTVGPESSSIAVGDFNGDGKPDMAVTSFRNGSGSVNVLLNVYPQPAGPIITSVQNAASFETTLAPGAYAAIFGKNLSTTSPGRAWTAGDFTSNSNGTLNMPTSLDGTSVTIGGKPAYVNYISPGQVNIITPPGLAGENVPVVLTVNGQSTLVFNATLQTLAPSFFTWQPDTSDFGKYLIAQHADYTNVGKAGLFPGTPANFTTPAQPGETIILWATGFGPTSPVIANGIETDKVYPLPALPTIWMNNESENAVFAGLIPGLSEVYQVNVTIPANTPNGDQSLWAVVNGQWSAVGLITVQQ